MSFLFPFVLSVVWLTEIPLSSTYSNGNPWLGWCGRWVDYPLRVDRSLTYKEGRYNQAQQDDFAVTMRKIADFGCLDGLTYNADRSYFHRYFSNLVGQPTNHHPTNNHQPINHHTTNNQQPTTTNQSTTTQPTTTNQQPTTKLIPNYQFTHGLGDEPNFAEAINNPAALRIGGKTLITSYWTDRHKPAQLKQKLDFLRDKYTDKFLFIASSMPFSQTAWNDFLQKEGSVPREEVERVKTKLRAYLRVADGLSCELYNFCALNPVDGERSLETNLFATCLKPYRELLDEPEFAGKKLFTINVGPGHANAYTFGNRNSSNGTRTLRGSIETALAFRPDILLFFEWDEWNENTSIKPTLWNSFTAMRILRAERAQAEKRPNEPVKDDDLSVPNLVLSFRKTLVLGEIARYEVLSVPDARTTGEYEIALTVRDESGRVVKSFAPKKLDATRLADCRFDFPSEIAGNAYALVPELTVRWRGQTLVFADGLPFAEIRATATWDRKWVSMPLRDLLVGARCSLAERPARWSGPTVEIAGSVPNGGAGSVPKGIDRLEILDGGELVYSVPGRADEDFRDDGTHVVFSCWNTLGRYSRKDAQISVAGVTEADWLIGTNRTSGLKRKVIAQSLYTPDTYLRLRRDEAEKAVVTLDWPEGSRLSIPVAKALANGICAVAGPTNQMLFAVRRFHKQAIFPSPVGKTSAAAIATLSPDLPVSVLGAHLLSSEGKIFRSKPLVVGSRSGRKTRVRVYSVSRGCPVDIEVDAERVPDLRYDFRTDETGIAVKSGYARAFDGILGAPLALVTQRNRGCSSFVCCSTIDEASRAIPCWAPPIVSDAGVSVLRFDGTGTYFLLPHATIPQNSAWRLSFDFKPAGDGRGMEVFSCGTAKMWSNLGRLGVDAKGYLTGNYVSIRDYRDTTLKSVSPVRADAWNHVEIIADVGTLELVLNGESAGKVSRTMPGRYDSNSWFGGRKDHLFKGLLREVKISHQN